MVCNVNIVYGNLKSENSEDYSQKPQRNCTFMNSASGIERYMNILLYGRHTTRKTPNTHGDDGFNSQTEDTELGGHRSSFLLATIRQCWFSCVHFYGDHVLYVSAHDFKAIVQEYTSTQERMNAVYLNILYTTPPPPHSGLHLEEVGGTLCNRVSLSKGLTFYTISIPFDNA